MTQELVLGTANFGDKYGISKRNKISSQETDRILRWSAGKIPELDSSEDYKGSHSAISRHSKLFKITTKIRLDQVMDVQDLAPKVAKLKSDLGKDRIDRLLLRPHSTKPTFTLDSLKELEKLRNIGEVDDIGLSIYETNELLYFANSIDFPISFQIPINLLNRSFPALISSNTSHFQNFTFYARSVFLQGLLLLDVREIPDQLREAEGSISLLNQELRRLGVSILEATFAFIRSQEWIKGVVVGVTNLSELKENYQVFNQPLSLNWDFLNRMPNAPERVLDPRLW
jgi:aryl-alcohol dehydrogenase-like predicted oxidoreductase